MDKVVHTEEEEEINRKKKSEENINKISMVD